MYRLSTSNRCSLFELIAAEIWDSIAFNHKNNVQESEIGITNKIIAVIRDHHVNNPSFGVWANQGVKEAIHGSDIDIFVETSTNRFLWYAIQAKVLKIGGKYNGLANKRQWNTLGALRKASGCIPFFLFYNGLDKEPENLEDCCGHQISEKQFGCTIAEIDEVKKITTSKPNPRYTDICPESGHPWRELVCCTAKRKDGVPYSLKQIQNATSIYTGIVNTEMIIRGSNNPEEANGYSTTKIVDENRNSNRVPSHVFAIRTIAGMNQ